MLVLSRKLGQKIYIGDNIAVTVVEIDRGKIRIGIEAPRDVPIWREEVLDLMRFHEQSAANFEATQEACDPVGASAASPI